MGRRKVEMKKIESSSSRLVTFSKRRSGIFKKANEISTLCAAEVAIIVFSPGGKPFSFGQPNIEKVVHKFQNKYQRQQSYKGEDDFTPLKVKSPKVRFHKLNQKVTNLDAQLEFEYKRSGEIDKGGNKYGLKRKLSISQLDLHQLTMLHKDVKDLCNDSIRRVNELEASHSLLLLANNSFSN